MTTWSPLNCFRTAQGHCGSCKKTRNQAATDLCLRCVKQTIVSTILCWRWSCCLADQLRLLIHTQEEEEAAGMGSVSDLPSPVAYEGGGQFCPSPPYLRPIRNAVLSSQFIQQLTAVISVPPKDQVVRLLTQKNKTKWRYMNQRRRTTVTTKMQKNMNTFSLQDKITKQTGYITQKLITVALKSIC